MCSTRYFYPRSPCGERPPPAPQGESSKKFLSTLSLRRATIGQLQCIPGGKYFYPRSPCGERHRPVTMHTWRKVFLSTLSLRRATRAEIHASSQQEFLSTLSLRRATEDLKATIQSMNISIHALLAESDSGLTAMWCRALNFYPRSPCGERHQL